MIEKARLPYVADFRFCKMDCFRNGLFEVLYELPQFAFLADSDKQMDMLCVARDYVELGVLLCCFSFDSFDFLCVFKRLLHIIS